MAEEARPQAQQRGSSSVGAAVGGRGGRQQKGSRGIVPLLTSSPVPPTASPTSMGARLPSTASPTSRLPGAEQSSFLSRTSTLGRADSPVLGAVTEEGPVTGVPRYPCTGVPEGRTDGAGLDAGVALFPGGPRDGAGLDAGGALVIGGPCVMRRGSILLADLGRRGSGVGPKGP